MIVHVGGKDSSSAKKPYEIWERDEQMSFTIRQTEATLSNWRSSILFFVGPDEFNVQP